MPLITRKEYAALCGDRPDAIVVWIKRGKIWTVPGNKKLVDTDNPINADFASERQLFNAAKELGETIPKPPTSVTKTAKIVTENDDKEPKKGRGRPRKDDISPAKRPDKPKPKAKEPKKSPVILPKPAEIRQKERVLSEQNAVAKLRMDQGMQKTALEIENLELAKQQKMLQLNKSAGNLLPVDLVKGVVKRHADTFFKTFEKSIERFISVICGSDQESFVKHLANVKDILSQTITDAGKMADEEILILIKDYSETLARGQKKI